MRLGATSPHPAMAVLLGSLPILICLVVASLAGLLPKLTAYVLIGIVAGLPMLTLVASVVAISLNRGASTINEVRPIGAGFLILAMYLIASTEFVREFVHLDLMGVGLGFLGVLTLVGGYLLVMACGYVLHAVFYLWIPKGIDPDFIIVNGGRLIDGDITTLLKSRLDRAIELYNQGGGRATILPSGGWTGDDTRSEADAMTEYLLANAIPADQIVPEDQSTTTRENLENCRHIIELRSGLASPNVVFVTSNYHVYRTALIARSAGINCHGVGSGTPLHLLPEAILREIAALFWMHKLWHSIPILAITLYYQVAVLPSERY